MIVQNMRPLLLPAAEHFGRRALTRLGARSSWLPTRHGHVHYYDIAGMGKLPTAVLLHGLGTTATAFAPLIQRLSPHFRHVIAPDHLGHGFSSGRERALSPQEVLEATTETLLRTIDEPALVVGNSMGGAVALKFALQHPTHVRGLLLVSPAGAPFTEEQWQEIRETFDLNSRRQAMQLFHRIYHRPPWVLRLLAHELPAHFHRPAVQSLLASAAVSTHVAPDELRALKAPILLLWGTSDRLLPRSQLSYFRQHLPPQARIEEPARFGHSPHLDASDAVGDYVVRFAQSLTGNTP